MGEVYAYTKNGGWYRHGLSMSGGENVAIVTLDQLREARRCSLDVDIPDKYFIEKPPYPDIRNGASTVTYRLYIVHETNDTHAKIEWLKYIGYTAGNEKSKEHIAITFMESVNG